MLNKLRDPRRLGDATRKYSAVEFRSLHSHHFVEEGEIDGDKTITTTRHDAIMQTMIRLFSPCYLKVASGLRRESRDREKEKGRRGRDEARRWTRGNRPKGNKDFCSLTYQNNWLGRWRFRKSVFSRGEILRCVVMTAVSTAATTQQRARTRDDDGGVKFDDCDKFCGNLPEECQVY